ncbi:MAG: type II secretion system protein [Burkholderiales bacterium]|nr:prepilin-type N-terminal cleavage/methylation domain-containing protein [Betaproteobacteria bacterium]
MTIRLPPQQFGPRRQRPALSSEARRPNGSLRPGFTLIELLVVLAIIGTLLAIALPRYSKSIGRAEEAVLQQNLRATREAIDQFHGDLGRYPVNLQELVMRRYLRELPVDPLTRSNRTWLAQPAVGGGIRDIRSGAPGSGSDGRPYVSW